MENLCDILIRQNIATCKLISKGKFNKLELYKYFKESAKEIFKVQKSLKSEREVKLSKEER